MYWVFVVAHGLSLVVASGGSSPVEVRGLLIAVALLVAEHRLQAHASAAAECRLSRCGSWALEHAGFSSCGAQAQKFWLMGSGAWNFSRRLGQLRSTGLLALQHVDQHVDQTHVSCTGRPFPIYCTSREVLALLITDSRKQK